METREKTAYISYANRLMTINTPYNAKFVEELKTGTKSRRWNAEKKVTCPPKTVPVIMLGKRRQ